MNTLRNPEVVDAVKLAFDLSGEEFEPATPDELHRMNTEYLHGSSKVIGESTRSLAAYDTTQGCYVGASEMFAVTQQGPDGEWVDGHLILLIWPDTGNNTCVIDMDSGDVSELTPDYKQIELDLTVEPERRQRIISALSALADSSLGLS